MQAHHPLDRPIWSSLTTRQAGLAVGDGRAVRWAPDYGLFAAAVDNAPESLAALASLVRAQGEVALVEAEAPPAVPGTAVSSRPIIWPVTAEIRTPGESPSFGLLPHSGASSHQ